MNNQRPTPMADVARATMQERYDAGELHEGVEELFLRLEDLERQRDTLLKFTKEAFNTSSSTRIRRLAREAIAAAKGGRPE